MPFRCDFCSTPDPSWIYPCEPFTIETDTPTPAIGVCEGEWVACEECHALIEAQDLPELALRSSRRFVDKWPQCTGILFDLTIDIERTFLAFVKHRSGPAKRIVIE